MAVYDENKSCFRLLFIVFIDKFMRDTYEDAVGLQMDNEDGLRSGGGISQLDNQQVFKPQTLHQRKTIQDITDAFQRGSEDLPLSGQPDRQYETGAFCNVPTAGAMTKVVYRVVRKERIVMKKSHLRKENEGVKTQHQNFPRWLSRCRFSNVVNSAHSQELKRGSTFLDQYWTLAYAHPLHEEEETRRGKLILEKTYQHLCGERVENIPQPTGIINPISVIRSQVYCDSDAFDNDALVQINIQGIKVVSNIRPPGVLRCLIGPGPNALYLITDLREREAKACQPSPLITLTNTNLDEPSAVSCELSLSTKETMGLLEIFLELILKVGKIWSGNFSKPSAVSCELSLSTKEAMGLLCILDARSCIRSQCHVIGGRFNFKEDKATLSKPICDLNPNLQVTVKPYQKANKPVFRNQTDKAVGDRQVLQAHSCFTHQKQHPSRMDQLDLLTTSNSSQRNKDDDGVTYDIVVSSRTTPSPPGKYSYVEILGPRGLNMRQRDDFLQELSRSASWGKLGVWEKRGRSRMVEGYKRNTERERELPSSFPKAADTEERKFPRNVSRIVIEHTPLSTSPLFLTSVQVPEKSQ
uniref:Uncharacterized protein n=1 Tax=Timema cristinae TaxID=61476 RepID=A0A7R9GRD9_TIMCR|nr:unnamed protein product [Timema cristinae]